MWQTLGFEINKKFFEQVIISGRLVHAYLFTGQEMIGKRTFALELINTINKHSDPLDRMLVETEDGNISIDSIRKAKSFLSLSPNVGPYKFVIVDNADQMTTEAQNAFLKVLEEASESSIIILVTAFKDALLPTILSRCQEIQFPNHSAEEIKKTLLVEKVSDEKAEFLSKFVNGRLGLALEIARENLFDQLKEYLSEFAKIKKEPLSTRLKLAQSLADEETAKLQEKILYWMLYLRMQSVEVHHSSLENLIDLNYNLSHTQFNHRLMLESFMVEL